MDIPGLCINKGKIVRVSWTTSAIDWYRMSLVLVTWSSAAEAIKSANTWSVKSMWVFAVIKKKKQENHQPIGIL